MDEKTIKERQTEAFQKDFHGKIKIVCQYLGRYIGYEEGSLSLACDLECNMSATWGGVLVYACEAEGLTIPPLLHITAYRPGVWEITLNAVYLEAVTLKVKQETQETQVEQIRHERARDVERWAPFL